MVSSGSMQREEQPVGPSEGTLSEAKRHVVRARSDLGPPALDELSGFGHMQSAQVEVLGQNVFGQLHQEAAVDPLPLEDRHRCLGQADEAQARRHLLQ